MKTMDWRQFAIEIFEVQNKIRQNPKTFIHYLEKCLERFQGNILYDETNTIGIEMHEGPMAYIEAIEFLRIQEPVPTLKWASQLQKAALDHIQDIGPQGLTTSLGTGNFFH